MPLNILLADDSVPAQNMGKKILMDAGYQVLTASNGLEALRKIAEAIPDIAILDIFMPGYTGLEICERLRASAATATLPVILTVGKLEPYRPQDGEHVHSNAVIVKPFAAAELISAVRSLIGAPPVVAESSPVGESHASNAGTDPFQKSTFATVDSHGPFAGDHHVPQPSQLAGGGQERDEPFFSSRASATQEGAPPWGVREPIVHGDAPSPSNEGPESLAFDPDARHTPFSASAIDLLPTATQAHADNGASAFTEFDLEPEASHYSPEEKPGESAAQEPPLATPAVVAEVGLDASQSPAAMADAVIVPEEVASDSPNAAEMEASSLGTPAVDPLLEVQETVALPQGGGGSILDSAEPPEELTPEVAAVDSEDALAQAEEVLTPEEEQRRAAFEALFNSTEPIPVENLPAEPMSNRTAILPSMADLSKDQPFNSVPDSEIEMLVDHRETQFVAPELDPYLMQEEAPRSEIGPIPERDPLLDDSLDAGWSGSISASRSRETIVAETAPTVAEPAVEQAQVVPEVFEHVAPTAPVPLEAVTTEVQNVAVEAEAAEPEIPAPAQPAETVNAAPETAEEQAQIVPEVEEHVAPTAPLPIEAVTTEAQSVAVEAEAAELEIPAPVQPAETVNAAPETAVEQAQVVAEVEEHDAPTAPQPIGAVTTEAQSVAAEAQGAEPEIPTPAHPVESVHAAPVAAIEQAQTVPEVLHSEGQTTAQEQAVQLETLAAPAAVLLVQVQPELAKFQDETLAAQSTSAPQALSRPTEAERIHQAVERVFDRFKPLLVAAIVRELARRD